MKWTLLAVLLLPFACPAEDCTPGQTKVQITGVEFEETSGLTVSLRNEIREQLESHIHDYCQLTNEMPTRARDILEQHGYFKALVRDPTWKQVGGTDTDQQLRVLLVTELGFRYTLDSIRFNGSNAFDEQTLRSAFPMQDGELFNASKVRKGLKNLRDLYCGSGYINFTPVPNTEIDDGRQTIKLFFDLDQGDQYRNGQLTVNGLEPYPGAGQKLLQAWAPHVGEVFDCRMVTRMFLSFAGLPQDSEKLPLEYKSNRETKTIDFDYNFSAH